MSCPIFLCSKKGTTAVGVYGISSFELVDLERMRPAGEPTNRNPGAVLEPLELFDDVNEKIEDVGFADGGLDVLLLQCPPLVLL